MQINIGRTNHSGYLWFEKATSPTSYSDEKTRASEWKQDETSREKHKEGIIDHIEHRRHKESIRRARGHRSAKREERGVIADGNAREKERVRQKKQVR